VISPGTESIGSCESAHHSSSYRLAVYLRLFVCTILLLVCDRACLSQGKAGGVKSQCAKFAAPSSLRPSVYQTILASTASSCQMLARDDPLRDFAFWHCNGQRCQADGEGSETQLDADVKSDPSSYHPTISVFGVITSKNILVILTDLGSGSLITSRPTPAIVSLGIPFPRGASNVTVGVSGAVVRTTFYPTHPPQRGRRLEVVGNDRSGDRGSGLPVCGRIPVKMLSSAEGHFLA
jgi:hypothetical protein